MSHQLYEPKKSLGQHWLHDPLILGEIARAAELQETDTVLEVGPGLGTLTAELSRQAGAVIAVELDEALATGLQQELVRQNIANVTVTIADILRFDLTTLPVGYKIVANIPYYLTSHLLRILTETTNKPSAVVLLMQKEVAERVSAVPGDMSILSVAVQLAYSASLGVIVPAHLFTPPPKVDSQVLILKSHNKYADIDGKQVMRLVKIGFAAKRKLLTNTLSAGYRIPKAHAADMMNRSSIHFDRRAEELAIDDWLRLLAVVQADGLA